MLINREISTQWYIFQIENYTAVIENKTDLYQIKEGFSQVLLNKKSKRKKKKQLSENCDNILKAM